MKMSYLDNFNMILHHHCIGGICQWSPTAHIMRGFEDPVTYHISLLKHWNTCYICLDTEILVLENTSMLTY